MHFAELYDRLKREGRVTHDRRRVIRQPGVAGFLMPVLAAVGKIGGYWGNRFEEVHLPAHNGISER